MGGAGLCARHGAALTVEQQWEGPGVLVHPGSWWMCQPGGKSLLWGHRGDCQAVLWAQAAPPGALRAVLHTSV